MNDHPKGAQPTPQLEALAIPRGKPWTVHVDVYLKSDADQNNPEFSIASCLPTVPRTINGKPEKYLCFENNRRPGFTILFQLHDETGQNYRFPTRKEDAVWSKKGIDCPDKNWAKNEVFQQVKVLQGDPPTLRVFFRNGKDDKQQAVGDFRYTLNVTKTGEAPYLALDPGGTGTNGQDN